MGCLHEREHRDGFALLSSGNLHRRTIIPLALKCIGATRNGFTECRNLSSLQDQGRENYQYRLNRYFSLVVGYLVTLTAKLEIMGSIPS